MLLEEDAADMLRYCSDGLAANIKKNVRYLSKNPDCLSAITDGL